MLHELFVEISSGSHYKVYFEWARYSCHSYICDGIHILSFMSLAGKFGEN